MRHTASHNRHLGGCRVLDHQTVALSQLLGFDLGSVELTWGFPHSSCPFLDLLEWHL